MHFHDFAEKIQDTSFKIEFSVVYLHCMKCNITKLKIRLDKVIH